MTLSRRHLLTGIALLSLWSRGLHASEADAADALLALLDDRATAAGLGSSWVQKDHLQPDAILEQLQVRLRQQGWAGEVNPDHLRSLMGAAVAEDFRSGAIVTIEGWQVARTQAELCALAYFASQGIL